MVGMMGGASERLAQVHRAFEQLQNVVKLYPLTSARLWHNDLPRTSQRTAVETALGEGVTTAVLVGGNRSGKTEAGAQLAVAYALGSAHPVVQTWARANSLELGSIQPGPGMVCCSALTGNDSIRVQRPKVTTYLPKATRWSNQYGHGEATARLPGGGTIIFKSNDQRARSYQGADWDFLWMDEEHDQPIFNEARMRLVDRAGRTCMTMTPLKGRTWVWEQFVNQPESGSSSYALFSADNPYIPQEYLRELLAQYGEHERAARARGDWTSLEGLVYPFERHLHLVPGFTPPREWTRYGAIDFGTRNPFAYVLAAMDPSDSVLHLYGLHYQREWTLRQHAEAIRQLNDQEPEWIVADPEDRGSRISLAREYGIATNAAKKGRGSVRSGINTVCERLRPDAEGRPHLVVHDTPMMQPLIREFESYSWATSNTKRDQPDAPLKRNDHAMDALRYLCSRLSGGTMEVG